ncbi:helix-turn-helix domain-containing protein [Candidatus Micrarchaeota archaeon]|nr:helix-turn-helix domain-containing protein [Candidatus Micrarchaeota archaeon]
MAKPLIATIEYNHDCICSDVPERYPDTSIRYLAELGEWGKAISHFFNISGADVPRFIKSLRAHPTTFDVKTVRKGKFGQEIITITKKDASTKFALKQSGCAFLSNPIYGGGIEKAHLFAPSFDSLRIFLDSLRNSYNVKVASKHYLKEDERIRPDSLVKSGFMDFVSAADLLTKRQAEALRLAGGMDYYDIPKRTSLAKIGDRMGISEAAAGELLRKAERKLMPAIAKIIEYQN